MNYRFESHLSEKEYNAFIEKQSMVSFMQNYHWCDVKNTWGGFFHCGLYQDDELKGVCLIIIRCIFKVIKLFYVPRGYVIDFEDKALLAVFTRNIKQLAKKNGAVTVHIDPNFCISDHSFKENEIAIAHHYSHHYAVKHQNLIQLGYKHRKPEKKMAYAFQPGYNIFVPLCDAQSNILTAEKVKKKFSRIKGYFGAYQEKRGVSFEITNDVERIDDLVFLLKETEKKHKTVGLRDKAYLQRVMDAYSGYAYLFFAKINLNTYIAFLKKNDPENTAKITEAEEARNQYGDIFLSSGALVILPQNKNGIRTSEDLYAGNAQCLKHLHISEALEYEIIKFSIDHQCHYCNLGGVAGTLDDNLTAFKRAFNGRIMAFCGEYDLPTSWLYYPMQLIYPIALRINFKIRQTALKKRYRINQKNNP